MVHYYYYYYQFSLGNYYRIDAILVVLLQDQIKLHSCAATTYSATSHGEELNIHFEYLHLSKHKIHHRTEIIILKLNDIQVDTMRIYKDGRS